MATAKREGLQVAILDILITHTTIDSHITKNDAVAFFSMKRLVSATKASSEIRTSFRISIKRLNDTTNTKRFDFVRSGWCESRLSLYYLLFNGWF